MHRRHVESFYVLEGELALTAGDREVSAEPGTWLQVTAGTPHVRDHGRRPGAFLNLHTPSCGFGAFLRGLHQARTADELSAVRAAFRSPRSSAQLIGSPG